MNSKIQAPKNPLRQKYGLHIQIGLILSLLIMISLFTAEFNYKPDIVVIQKDPEPVIGVETPITEIIKIPPKPALPVVPVVVSNETIIDEDLAKFMTDDFSIDLNPIKYKPAVSEESSPFEPLEFEPEIIGGIKEVYKHISYPELARNVGIQGKVILQFKVNTNGKISNVKVLRGIGGGCDEAAIEAVKKIKFKPGIQRGRPVSVQYTLPITFKLQS